MWELIVLVNGYEQNRFVLYKGDFEIGRQNCVDVNTVGALRQKSRRLSRCRAISHSFPSFLP